MNKANGQATQAVRSSAMHLVGKSENTAFEGGGSAFACGTPMESGFYPPKNLRGYRLGGLTGDLVQRLKGVDRSHGLPAQAFTVWRGKPIADSTTGKAPRSGGSLPTHGPSERNPALGRSDWMLSEATGKPCLTPCWINGPCDQARFNRFENF